MPVLPVARELISKTKWVNSKGHHSSDNHRRVTAPRSEGPSRQGTLSLPKRLRTFSAMSRQGQTVPAAPKRDDDLSMLGLVSEADTVDQEEGRRSQKKNLLKVFRKRSKSRSRGSFESASSASVSLEL